MDGHDYFLPAPDPDAPAARPLPEHSYDMKLDTPVRWAPCGYSLKSGPRFIAVDSAAHPGRTESLSLVEVWDEVKKLGNIGGGNAALNWMWYFRSVISVVCLGKLGNLELAGGVLAIGFNNITGYSVLSGLSSGMDPVCSQACGSQNGKFIGLTLKRITLILFVACIPISVLWFNLQPIMLLAGQDEAITAVASTFCLYSLPDLLGFTLWTTMKSYLRSQAITGPLVQCSAIAMLFHFPAMYFLVFYLGLGVPGVPIANFWTNLNMVLFLGWHLWYYGTCERTWASSWSSACLQEWRPLLRLALPSCCGICLEWWWYEILTLLAGYLPDPQAALAATGILIQTTSLMYNFPDALGGAACTRVGNELGADRPERARVATIVSLTFALVISTVNIAWATVFRNSWGLLFTRDANVLSLIALAMPILGLSELGNCPQTVGCGVLRGSARPGVSALINFAAFYLVGAPVATTMAFAYRMGFQGLWYGLLAATATSALSILVVLLQTDWTLEASRSTLMRGDRKRQTDDENVEAHHHNPQEPEFPTMDSLDPHAAQSLH